MAHIRTLAALLTLFSTSFAYAEGSMVPPVKNTLVEKECGTCHMAFQPAFLTARSWQTIMDDLSNHFGDDASLAPDKTKIIREYLMSNAGDVTQSRSTRKYMQWSPTSDTPQRITENPAFLRKHSRFMEKVKTNPRIVTISNCPACHTAAQKGWYDDD